MVPGRVPPLPPASVAQCAHKAQLQGEAFEKHIARPPTAYHADMYAALASGRIAEYYEALVVSDEELEQGVAAGPARRRHAASRRAPAAARPGEATAASARAFPLPTLVEDAEYAVEAAVLGEADVVRLQRRLDELERRLQTVEQRLPGARTGSSTRRAARPRRPRRLVLGVDQPARFTALTPTITS